MHLVRNSTSFPFEKVSRGSIVTIGAFDGLHLGHQRLLETTLAKARSASVPAVVMSFEPTPKEFFAADCPPARLTRFREKFDGLAAAGIDLFFCPRFNASVRDMSAADFIRVFLAHTCNLRGLVIGDDFRFARRQEGDVDTLRRAARALDFEVEQVPSVIIDDERVSSTAIRQALAEGDLSKAKRFLGRAYRMSGRVIPGQKLGRSLGYPTANVNLHRRQSAVLGIFAVRVAGIAADPVDGVASVGTRPTFDGTRPLLEVHLFDFDGDLYGRYIHVDFVARLRDEVKFESAEALIEQMHADARDAREILAE